MGWVENRRFYPKKPLAAYNNCAIKEFPTENGPADYLFALMEKFLASSRRRK